MVTICLAAVASVVAAGGAASLALAEVASPSAGVLTVSTIADAVNGDVSSPAALVARPGPDGISLREAITAADNASGRETITFARALAGQTIAPTKFLPALTRDNAALIGLVTPDGQPAVTLDAGKTAGDLLAVYASGVTVSHLRIVNAHNGPAISVRAGEPGGELAVHDVLIGSNVLDNNGVFGVGVWVGTSFPGNLQRSPPTEVYPGAVNASVTDVTVAHNVIQGFKDDGINVGLPGTHCSISGLLIEDNTLATNTGAGSPALELDTNYSGNSIVGTRILRNTFTGNWAGMHLNGGVAGTNNANGNPIPASGNVISGTVIAQNVFDGNSQAIAFGGGAGLNATGNAVLDTEISDNVMMRNAPFGAIGIDGGESPNRVDGVHLINDTVAFNDGGINIRVDGAGSSISNVDAQNTIFWNNGRDVSGPDASSVLPAIRSSLMGVDPRFVSAQDLHLQAGSSAIDAGTSNGAPTFDFEDRARVGAPDIGAYEFGAPPRPRLAVLLEALGGVGTVISSPTGIACEMTCEAAFDTHTAVTLTAAPASGSRFAGWSGACSGTGACTLTLTAAATVSATFTPRSAARPAPKLAAKCNKGQRSSKRKPCRT
jgi:hypothetical protein